MIYYRSSGLTWSQYLQADSFVQDVTGQIQRSNESMISAISNQTQNIVASNEALARGFEYGLEQISGEIAELRAAFDYSMGLALEQLRIQTRTLEGILDQLDAIHETLQHPLLTQARELSKIGMGNLSKGLLQEGLESLLASVDKYKADFLVQLQIGKLYLYGKNTTDDVIDLPNAKEHLLLAARYANSEISSLPDAAKFCAEAFLHSAITCYAQANEKWLAGDVEEAKRFTEEALELSQNATQVYPQLAEAFYNHAKFAALLNDGETTVNSLKTAILIDRNYCLKADADKDFDGVREYVRNLFESLRQQVKEEATKALASTKRLLDDWVYRSSTAKQGETQIRELLGQTEPLYQKDTYFDYLDALSLLKEAQDIFDYISLSFVEITTLTGHSGSVFAFSPDGRYLVSRSEGNTVKIYQTDGFKEIAILTGHSDNVNSVSFSPDGRYLASGSGKYKESGMVKIYQTDGFKEIATLTGHSNFVYSVAFSPDGKYLASGSGKYEESGMVKIYQTDGFKEIATLTGHSNFVYSVAFSPDGKYLASGSWDNTVKIYQTDGFKEIATLTGHSGYVNSVSFSPDGRYLASGSGKYKESGMVKIYQTDGFKEIATLTGHSSYVTSVAFSPDGRFLASGSYDETVKVYRVDSFEEVVTLTGHSSYVTSVVFSPDGRFLASGGNDQTVKIWGEGIISRQEFEQQEKRRIEAEREAEQQRKKAEAEAKRRRKEQELRANRLKNKLCLECGEKLDFWDKLTGAQYCKRHRK